MSRTLPGAVPRVQLHPGGWARCVWLCVGYPRCPLLCQALPSQLAACHEGQIPNQRREHTPQHADEREETSPFFNHNFTETYLKLFLTAHKSDPFTETPREKCLGHHLVAACRRDHKPCLLHVSGWDMDQTNMSKYTSNNFFSVIWGSSCLSDACSSAHQKQG